MSLILGNLTLTAPVSYTHLDVYKRQIQKGSAPFSSVIKGSTVSPVGPFMLFSPIFHLTTICFKMTMFTIVTLGSFVFWKIIVMLLICKLFSLNHFFILPTTILWRWIHLTVMWQHVFINPSHQLSSFKLNNMKKRVWTILVACYSYLPLVIHYLWYLSLIHIWMSHRNRTLWKVCW